MRPNTVEHARLTVEQRNGVLVDGHMVGVGVVAGTQPGGHTPLPGGPAGPRDVPAGVSATLACAAAAGLDLNALAETQDGPQSGAPVPVRPLARVIPLRPRQAAYRGAGEAS